MKRYMIRYVAALAVLLYGVALGDGLGVGGGWIVSSAMSGRMVVDTRAGKGTLVTDHAEDIAYSGLWDGDAGATVTVAVNGRTVKTATGEGVYVWPLPSAAGTYTLTHRTTKNGKQVGETLTAIFKVTSSPLTYMNLKGATHANPATYEEGTEVSFTDPSPVTGYTFTGWTPARITASMTGAQMVRANWRANTYTIAYNANGGAGTTVQTAATYDADVRLARNGFTREGYVFAGWATHALGPADYQPGATVRNLSSEQDGVITLYAVWMLSFNTVLDNTVLTFDTDGDAAWYGQKEESHFGGSAAQSGGIGHNGKSRLTTTVSGSVMLSFWWKVSSEQNYDKLSISVDGTEIANISGEQDWTQKTIQIMGDGTHTVVWMYDKDGSVSRGFDCGWVDQVVWRRCFAISYVDLKGATHTNPSAYEEGTALTFTNPGTVAGYTFTGWTPAQITESMTGPQAVRANWRVNTYTVAYDANGGSGRTAQMAATYGTDVRLAQGAFTRTGYTFVGWATRASGSAVYQPGETVRNLSSEQDGVVTLYAVWRANTYTIAYNANGGSGATAQTAATYDADARLSRNGFTREGYMFAGWSTRASGPVVYQPGVAVRNLSSAQGGVVTLYAVWAPTFNTALGNRSLAFGTDGDAPWYGQTEESHSGGSAARSGAVGDGEASRLTTEVSGEGTLSFWWRVSSQPGRGILSVSVDGVEWTAISGERGWARVEVPVTRSGTHSVVWTYRRDSSTSRGSDCGWVDEVDWRPSLGNALDNASLVFDTDEDAAWYGQMDESHFGGSAARSGGIGYGGATRLATAVFGAGTLTFWWKVSSMEDYDKLAVSVDGTEIANISGERGWALMRVPVRGAGLHTVVWSYRKYGSTPHGSDCGWVDQVAWMPLGAALGNTVLAFDTDGDAAWFVQSEVSHSGGSAAQSGAIGDDGETRLTTTVPGPGTLSFWWKVSSERNYDKLSVSVDDRVKAFLSGEQGWVRQTLTITEDDSHTIAWTYDKDGSASGGSDCGWVDDVVWKGRFAIAYTNLKDATHANPTTYEEGTEVSFTDPSAVRGYTFAGWTPARITASTTGPLTVRANWRAHTYTIAYNANGGSGEMEPTAAAYDEDVRLAWNGFTRAGYAFAGWARRASGSVVYEQGEEVRNLSAAQGGVVTLYAVWTPLPRPSGATLDNAALVFGTDGDAPWFEQTEEFVVGKSAARSGAVGRGGVTRLTTTVSGTGTLSFWWKVSSETGYDTLTVSVDGEDVAVIFGEQEWERVSIPVKGAGAHTVVWTFRRDTSVSRGFDCGWVDGVAWTQVAPPNVPPVADAAWTFVRGASAAKPSVLVSPDGKWRLRAAGPEDGTVYVSFYNPLAEDESEEWEFKSCVERGGADLTLPVRARDEGNGRVYGVAFLGECFTDYTALKRVTVPDALDADLAEAFLGVPNLASFAVGGGNPRYFARDGALFVHEQDGYANVLLHYPNGKAGTAYTVPEGVEAVSAWAFGNYGKLKTVTLPVSLRSWGTDSDWGNDNEWYAASRLERIELADGNPYLKVAGGALYTADGETLLRYPPARAGASATVAYGTRRIAPAAFAYAGKLTSVSLPATLRTLGASAFSGAGLTGVEVPEGVTDISDAFCGAKKLVTVSLPSTLHRIDDGAFHDCAALKRVDLANPRISLRGDGCEDEDDYICWGERLPAAFGIRVSAGSSVTSATSGHFHDTRGKRHDVPILPGTCPVPVLVTLRMDGGENVTVSRLPGEKYGDALAAPGADEMAEHPGCVFRGWYTQPDGGGTRAAADDIVPAHAVTLYPWWYALPTAGGGEGEDEDLRLARFDSEEDGTAFASARTYDGYLYEGGEGTDPDGGAGGRRIAGTILVKTAVARTDRRTGWTTARATVTIQIPGERRVSLSGEMDAGTSPGFLSVTAKDGRTLDLVVGADGIAGVFDDYGIDGARNVFSSRTATDRVRASEVLSLFKDEAVNLAWEDGMSCGWNGLSVKVGSAGRTRITGTLADGTRVSATAQLVAGEDWFCIPVVVDRKPHRLAFCLWLSEGCMPGLSCRGVEGLDGDVRFGLAGAVGMYGDGGAAFRIDTRALGELFGDWTYEGYGPDGVSVEQVGTKWRVAGGARPGRVVLGRDGLVDETKTGGNPSALTLAYRAKEGTFTGAFKYYVPSARGAPVAKPVNVYGVVVDGVGYGTAVVRGKGGVSVMVD